jgi:hypothetical protein
MELIEGSTLADRILADRIKEGPLSQRRGSGLGRY